MDLTVPSAGEQGVAVVEKVEPARGDRVGQPLDSFVEGSERVPHRLRDAEPVDDVDHREPIGRLRDLGDVGPSAHHGGVRRVGQPAGGADVIGVTTGDQHLGDLAKGSPVGRESALDQLGAVRPQHAGVDDGDGLVKEDVAVDGPTGNGRKGGVHDAGGQWSTTGTSGKPFTASRSGSRTGRPCRTRTR